MIRFTMLAAALSLVLPAAVSTASAAGGMDQCHREAADCMRRGGDRVSCQARVDECMSRNACEEVYLSCLELMEVEEDLTEAQCQRKREKCAAKRRD